MAGGQSRYETIKDYVLLSGGVLLLLATIGEGIAGDVQLAIAFLGGTLTCWGLVPTLSRDKER